MFNIDCGDYVPLGNLIKIQKGQQINGENLSENGAYYVMNGGIVPSGYFDGYNTPANSISISEGGNSCGYVQFNTEPFWSGGHCYTLLEPNNGVNYKFLYHYLKYKEPVIMALRIGSGLPNIQKKDLEHFPIININRTEQDAAVIILDKLASKTKIENQILSKFQIQKHYLLATMFI